MICLKEVKRYCQECWKIENYDQAVVDESQTWHCHHRFEIEYNLSKIELQAMGFYFNRPFNELIFLTPKEHKRLHMEGENHPNYGKEGYWKGKVSPNKGNYKHHITAEELYDLYVVQGLSQPQIAELYNCSQMCIWHKLKNFNIPTRSSLEVLTKYNISKEGLYDLYVVQGLSTYKIADIYNCCVQTICNKLKKYNIKK